MTAPSLPDVARRTATWIANIQVPVRIPPERLPPGPRCLESEATEVMSKLPWYALADEPAPAVLALPPQLSRMRRVWKGQALMHFHRLVALALIANVGILIAGVYAGTWASSPAATVHALSNLVLGNFALAILVRQHHVVNVLFWIATRAPVTWPLSIRATLAKVYHFGGLHVGGAIAATGWFVALAIELLAHRGDATLAVTPVALAVVLAQLAILVAITVMSMPAMRARFHDAFEVTKRFGGWASLILFWVQTQMLGSPAQIWVLAIVTFSVALPWLRLRRVPVEIVTPSTHVALARFDYGVTPFAGSSTAISRNPLREWHSFANVPAPGVSGYRLTISRAGDWTGAFIDDKPSHVWVKGIPTAGVANIETLFKKVVYVATGSGIGPCLPHLLACKVPAKLIWATRDARLTYGDGLVDEILAKHPDALIWDTQKRGKPDMVALAYQALVETGAEAVICISNKKLTWQVVTGMESRGIPAYGAIWDS